MGIRREQNAGSELSEIPDQRQIMPLHASWDRLVLLS
jgi:hypothetical protein